MPAGADDPGSRGAPSGGRVLGIVGGTGPESTIDYYRSLIRTWRRRRPDGSYPRVVIDSVEGGSVIRLLGEGAFEDVGRILGSAIAELEAAGCGLALIASNAGHLAFHHLRPAPGIRLVHIVDVAREAALAGGHRRLGLLGTTFVARSRLYRDRFEPAGLELVVPPDDQQEVVQRIYLDELVLGEFRPDSRDRLVEVIANLRMSHGIDGLILGGTELALTLTEPAYAGVPILNTAQLHVDAAVDWLLGP
jgi:aspartate racemase